MWWGCVPGFLVQQTGVDMGILCFRPSTASPSSAQAGFWDCGMLSREDCFLSRTAQYVKPEGEETHPKVQESSSRVLPVHTPGGGFLHRNVEGLVWKEGGLQLLLC